MRFRCSCHVSICFMLEHIKRDSSKNRSKDNKPKIIHSLPIVLSMNISHHGMVETLLTVHVSWTVWKYSLGLSGQSSLTEYGTSTGGIPIDVSQDFTHFLRLHRQHVFGRVLFSTVETGDSNVVQSHQGMTLCAGMECESNICD
jgi:hypothetical protein